MLVHDMRSPLNTMLMTAQYLAALNAGANVSDAAACLIRGGASMKALLDDLTDFNRTTLGLGIKIDLAAVDLAALFRDELEQLRGAYPSRQIEFEVVGDTEGTWDGVRLQRSEEHTSELQSPCNLVCRLLLEKKNSLSGW